MASKDNDLEFDDFEDFDFDDLDTGINPPEDDRSPIRKLSSSFAAGVADDLKDKQNMKRRLSESLPEGYGKAVNLADDLAGEASSLYNTVVRETGSGVREFKRASEHVLKRHENKLPKGLAERLKKMVATEEKQKRLSEEEIRDEEINNNLAAIFEVQHQQTEREASENIVRDQVEETRHKGVVGQLDAIREAANRLVSYQDQVTARYQRKSLEMQYRQYFVTRDLYRVSEQSAKDAKEALQAIAKNTALPEYRKMELSEVGGQMLRQRLMGAAQSRLTEYMGGFFNNFRTNLENAVTSRAKGVGDNLSMVAGQMDMAREAQEMGASIDPTEMAGQMAGGQIGGMAMNWLTPHLRRFSRNNETLTARGSYLNHLLNLPRQANEYARSSTEGGFVRRNLEQFFKDTIPQYQLNREAGDIPLMNADEHVPFTNLTRRSITEIIPGYLSRIHQEIRILRTGDESTGRLTFNMDKGEFTSTTEATRDVARRIFSTENIQRSQERIKEFTDEIDSDWQLSPEARRALTQRMIEESAEGRMFDAARFSDESFYGDGVSEDIRQELAEMFRTQFEVDDDGQTSNNNANLIRIARASKRFNRLGTEVADPGEYIRSYLETGQREALNELGLITRDGNTDRIDYDRIWQILQDGTIDGEDPHGLDGGPPAPGGGPGNVPGGGGRFNPVGIHAGYRGDPRHLTSATAGHPSVSQAGVEARILELAQHQRDHAGELMVVLREMRDHFQQQEKLNEDPRQSLVVEAIKSGNVKEESKQQVALLGRIIEQLEAGIAVGDGGGRSTMGNVLGRVGNAASSVGGKIMGFYGNAFGGAGKLIGGAGKLGGGLLGRVGDKVRGYKDRLPDIYVKGSWQPALRAHLLQAGEYRDQVTGKVISSMEDLKDLKGPVVDQAGRVMLSLDDIRQGLHTHDGRSLLRDAAGLAGKIANGLFAPSRMIFGTAGRLGRGVVDAVKSYANRIKDVYVKGEELPRLQAVILKNGGYVSAATGKVITSIKDIDGDVKDLQGNVVLSLQDMRRGLVDVRGRSLDFLGRVGGHIKQAIKLPGKALRWGMDKGRKAIDFGMSAFSRLFGGATNLFGGGGDSEKLEEIQEKSHSVLVEIRDILDKRLPDESNRWDKSGDGFRDGSWQSQFANREAANDEDEPEEKKEPVEGILGGLGGLLSNIFGRFMPGGGDGGGDTNIDIWGDPRGEKDDKKNDRRKRNRKPKGKLGRLWQGTKNLARGTRGVGGRAASWLGRQALMRGAMSGAGALASKVGLGALAGKGVAALGTAAAAVAGAPLWAVGAAVIGVGALGYFAYRRLTRRTMGALQKLRFMQYGVREDEKDQVAKILYLEDTLSPHVEFSDGEASFNAPDLDVQKLMTDFGVDLNDRQHILQFEEWMLKRFMPVYLAHRSALKNISPGTKLKEIDKELDKSAKRDFLELIRANYREKQDPYRVNGSPFTSGQNLSVLKSEIDEYFTEVENELREEENTRSQRRAGSSILGADLSSEALQDTAEGQTTETSADNVVDLDTARRARGVTSREGVDVTAGGTFSPMERDRRTVRALDAVRFRVYGLAEFTESRVAVIRRMEEEILEDVSFSGDGDAEFEGNSRNLAFRYGGYFGIRPHNNRARRRWLDWFQNRYLPTYLTYLSGLYAVSHNLEAAKVQIINRPELVLELAEKLANLMVEYGDEEKSVWEVDANPFGDGEINTDPNSVQVNLDILRDRVEEHTLLEERANISEEDEGNSRSVPESDQSATRNQSAEDRASQSTTSSRPSTSESGGGSTNVVDLAAVRNGRSLQSADAPLPPSTPQTRRTLPTGEGYRTVARALVEAGITDPEEQAMALAQLGHESGNFTQLEENLNYSAEALLRVFGRYFNSRAEADRYARNAEAIANRVYGGRMGNVDPGDGWKYRGRGFIQLTGRDNYERVSEALGIDYVNNPDLLLEPEHAAKASLWWWKNRNGLRPAAQQGDVRTSTRLINGGYNGLPDRQSRFRSHLPDAQGGEITRTGMEEMQGAEDAEPMEPMEESAVESPSTMDILATRQQQQGQVPQSSTSQASTPSTSTPSAPPTPTPRQTIAPPSIDQSQGLQQTQAGDSAILEARTRQRMEAQVRDREGEQRNMEMARSMGDVEVILRESLTTQRSMDERLSQVVELLRQRGTSEVRSETETITPDTPTPIRPPTRQVAEIVEGAIDLRRRRAG